MTLQQDSEKFNLAVRQFGDALLRPLLPFYAWLLPKLGLRMKPKYQRMLDDS